MCAFVERRCVTVVRSRPHDWFLVISFESCHSFCCWRCFVHPSRSNADDCLRAKQVVGLPCDNGYYLGTVNNEERCLETCANGYVNSGVYWYSIMVLLSGLLVLIGR